MGICYWLENEERKEIYELGKGDWEGLLNRLSDKYLPLFKNPSEIAKRLYKLSRDSRYFEVDKVPDAKALTFISVVSNDIFNLQQGSRLRLRNDAGDDSEPYDEPDWWIIGDIWYWGNEDVRKSWPMMLQRVKENDRCPICGNQIYLDYWASEGFRIKCRDIDCEYLAFPKLNQDNPILLS